MTRLTVQRADGLREALLLLAAADMARARLADPQLGPGVLHHRLILDLTDMVKAQARHRACHISYEAACTLSLGERQALFLRYALDRPDELIAAP